MTLRPHIIRADTLDLQDHEAPSAGDHARQPEHPGPLGSGPPAPHQEDALRHVSQGRHAEQDHLADAWGSGRSSHEGSELLDEDLSALEETRLDEAAIQQNGGDASDDRDGDGEDSVLDDDIMDDRSSSPSIQEDEIDPDFVYALHNFVATVEGQANATKGDHMVLLDDTNSYWWLVRVVKDSSIGYLPAEHIETPNERFARLMKHRNIQNTQSALEDFQPKTKNPLKKAMRRRNAKTVQFAAPTFYEPPDVDWSDIEGDSDHEEESVGADSAEKQNGQQAEIEAPADSDSSQAPAGQALNGTGETSNGDESKNVTSESTKTVLDGSTQEQDSLEQQERAPTRSRNGTMRNTDSFFKDDTSEPRKISLTPNILRDESGETSARSSGSTEKASPSQDVFEQLDNAGLVADKTKEDKKKKDKKSGMLSGLFKRKDKKIKVDEAAGGVVVKHEVDSGSPILTPGDSGPGSPTRPESPSASASQVLQSAKRPGSSGNKITKSPPAGYMGQSNGMSKPSTDSLDTAQPAAVATAAAAAAAAATTEKQLSTSDETPEDTKKSLVPSNDQGSASRQLTVDTSSASQPQTAETTQKSLFSANSEMKREKLTKAKQRMDLDVESSPEEAPTTNGQFVRDVEDDTDTQQDTLSSPIDRSSESATPRPNLALDTSAQGHRSISPPTPFDTMDSAETAPETQLPASVDSSTRSATTAAESGSTPTASSSPASATTPPATESNDQSWNDSALRTYLDQGSNADVKDMIIRVHDPTGVTPLPLDHPKMLGFGFHESQKQLDEMSSQLDSLLSGFLARSAARPKKAA